MISDLDNTLKQLLIKMVPLDPAEVDICFDMPDRNWSASISKPSSDRTNGGSWRKSVKVARATKGKWQPFRRLGGTAQGSCPRFLYSNTRANGNIGKDSKSLPSVYALIELLNEKG